METAVDVHTQQQKMTFYLSKAPSSTKADYTKREAISESLPNALMQASVRSSTVAD